MGVLRVGAGLAAVVAGPPLYAMVSAGSMDEETALSRGAVVLAGCALGAWLVARIIGGYRREIDAAARRARAEAEAARLRKVAKIDASLDGVPEGPSKDHRSG